MYEVFPTHATCDNSSGDTKCKAKISRPFHYRFPAFSNRQTLSTGRSLTPYLRPAVPSRLHEGYDPRHSSYISRRCLQDVGAGI